MVHFSNENTVNIVIHHQLYGQRGKFLKCESQFEWDVYQFVELDELIRVTHSVFVRRPSHEIIGRILFAQNNTTNMSKLQA